MAFQTPTAVHSSPTQHHQREIPMHHRRRALGLSAVLFLASLAPAAFAQQAPIKIADLTTPIPGGTGNFTRLSQPQVSLGNIVFTGAGPNNQLGIYRFDSLTRALSPIIDNNDARLPPGGALASFDQLGMSVYGPDVSFIGWAQFIGNALYTTRGGLRRVPGV